MIQKYKFLKSLNNRIFSFILLGTLFLLFSCGEKKQDEFLQKNYYKRLDGVVNGQNAVLHLIKTTISNEGEKGGLVSYKGKISLGGEEAPREVTGTLMEDSTIELVIYKQASPEDTLRGLFTKGKFLGYTVSAGNVKDSFSLKEDYPKGSYPWEVSKYRDSIVADSADPRSAKAVADLMTLWPSKNFPEKAGKLVIDSVSSAFYGLSRSYPDPASLLKAKADTFLINYKQDIKELLAGGEKSRPTFNWNLSADMEIVLNERDKASILFSYYTYTGGAHGMSSVFSQNVDARDGREIILSDIFEEGYEKILRQELEDQIRYQYDIPEGQPLNGPEGVLFEDSIPVTSNFYLAPNGIGFIYNPYEVAPYVVGIVDLFVPYQRLKSVLKEGWLKDI